MKKSVGKVSIITTALSMLLGVPLIVLTNKGVTKVDGYSASSLPTTIDLNDTTEANIRSYYSSLNNLSTAERQGTNLLKNLKTILKNGQKYYSYDSTSAIWQIYEIADRDWSKSPASSTTYGTYNSSTNKITGYTYGTSSSSSRNNPYIHALYINRDITNQTTAWDDHQQTQWGINREHVWPKAEGFETSGAGGARGDPMHLMAGNGYANNIHSNYYYGYVNTSSSYTNCGTKYSNLSGNLLGKSKTLGGSTNVFEPQDSDKGDIARAIFYMVARYNYLSGSDSDGIDSNNPNLTLTQSLSDWSSTGYSSTISKTGKMGILTDMLNWHHQDPVDEFEIHRNNLLYTNYTNNRNPFIDFPEWADFIWGTALYNGTIYSSYNSNPTGYATPSNDTINGYNSGGSTDPVSVTSVTLAKDSISIEVGESEVLSYAIAPSNATNQDVTWTSSNTSVATVSSSGRVVGVAEGNATITIRTSDGNFTDTCAVTVTESSSGSSEGTEEGSVTAASGALSGWNASGIGSAYADGSVKMNETGSTVYKSDIFSGDISSGMTSLTVTLNCKYNSTTGDASANVYTVEAIDSSGNPIASDVKSGDLVIPSSYGDVVFEISGDLSGCTGIRITYTKKGANNLALKSVSWSATYSQGGSSESTLSSIAVSTAPTKLTYTAGDDFVPAGLIITATYSDASSVDIPYENNEDSFEFDPSENLQTSDTSVTISYGGKTCSQSITVNAAAKTLSSISVNTAPTKVSYTEGECFDPTGLIITRTYSDSTSDTYAYDDHKSEFTFVPSTASRLTTDDTSVTITYGGKSCYQSISVSEDESGTWDYTFGAKVWSEEGLQTLDGKTWTMSGDDDGTPYFGYDTTKGQQFGSGSHPYSAISLQSSDFSGKITSVIVYTSGASSISATVQVSVGGTAYGTAKSITTSNTGYTFDLGGKSGTISINFDNSSSKAIYIKQIIVNYENIEPTTYTLVTDLSTLGTGDEIVFGAYHTTSKKYFAGTGVSGYYFLSEEVSVSDGVLTPGASTGVFEVTKNGSYYSFKHGSEGYLKYYTSNTYVNASYSASINDSCQFTFPSIDSSSGALEGHLVNTELSSYYFRFNYNNGNNSRFVLYTSSQSGSGFSVRIYKKTAQVQADSWSSSFLIQTVSCNDANWSSLSSSYNSLSKNAKTEIISCEANVSNDYNLRSQAMARYEYMLSRDSSLSNFITGRSVSPARPNLIPMILSGENSNVAIIIIISLVSVSTVGGYFFLKSRKKENI